MLLGFREPAFAVSARGFVQLVLGPDSIDNPAPGTSGNKDRQNNGDTGLREFHLYVTPNLNKTGTEQQPGKFWAGHRSSPIPYLLRKIVNLQSDRTRAGAFNGIDDFYDVTVFRCSWRLHKNSLLDAIFVLQIRARFHANLISALLLALRKRLGQLLRQRRCIIHRTE